MGSNPSNAKGTMRLILLILVLFLLLGAAGAAAWFFFLQPEPETEEMMQEEEPEEESPPVFVEFNPIQVPVLGDDGADELVNLIVALEVMGQENADRIITLAPRLNDAFLVELYGGLSSQDIITRSGLIDVERLKVRLRFASNRVLGDGVVTDVLVQLVSQRPI